MKFALHFGNNTFSDPEGARRLVRLAEAAGFDSVFAVEHVVFPDNYTSIYPYAPGGRLPMRNMVAHRDGRFPFGGLHFLGGFGRRGSDGAAFDRWLGLQDAGPRQSNGSRRLRCQNTGRGHRIRGLCNKYRP